MAKVGIVMGSDSDMPIMSKAADILEKLGIDYEIKIISAHREPDVFFEYAKTAEEIAEKTKSDVIQVIGTKFILYRKNQQDPKIVLPKSKKKS